MTDRLERIFRIWILLVPIGLLLLATGIMHFTIRLMHPTLFLLPNDPTAWLLLATGILLLLAGTSLGFKARVIRLVRQSLTWVQRQRGRH